ncbi:MAG: hypothetical protein ACYC46_08800 [Acidobacteriaceae bacterium]
MAAPQLGAVLGWIVRHPFQALVVRWNWKAGLLSAFLRALIFFFANLSAGGQKAFKAMLVEAVYASLASGVFGAITQKIRNARPEWLTGLMISIGLPGMLQFLQYWVHFWMGTPKLMTSMVASILFAAMSSLFNWYVMRHGTLLTGGEGRTLLHDVCDLPRLLLLFLAAGPRTVLQSYRRRMAAQPE